MPIDLHAVRSFYWDSGNECKNSDKHGVTQSEAEQVFLNEPLLLLDDAARSSHERRYHALGYTDAGRELHLTFTLRAAGAKLRIISARDMSRKERGFDAKA